MAKSIDDNELASPILVRPLPETETYELVCGENRLEVCMPVNMSNSPGVMST